MAGLAKRKVQPAVGGDLDRSPHPTILASRSGGETGAKNKSPRETGEVRFDFASAYSFLLGLIRTYFLSFFTILYLTTLLALLHLRPKRSPWFSTV